VLNNIVLPCCNTREWNSIEFIGSILGSIEGILAKDLPIVREPPLTHEFESKPSNLQRYSSLPISIIPSIPKVCSDQNRPSARDLSSSLFISSNCVLSYKQTRNPLSVQHKSLPLLAQSITLSRLLYHLLTSVIPFALHRPLARS
jgi:hypothetical protein